MTSLNQSRRLINTDTIYEEETTQVLILGLGTGIKVLEIGEVIKFRTKRKKFCE
jgi:hypothetical protein